MKCNIKENAIRFIAAFMVCVVFVAGFSDRTFAATSGGADSRSITVTTKSNWAYPGSESITLKQSKMTVTYTYQKLNGKTKTKTKSGYYGYYTISIYNETDGVSEGSIDWKGGQTKKITLKGNKKYKITVSYNYLQTCLNEMGAAPIGYSIKSYVNPSWRVSSTWKVSSYS